MCGKYLHTKEKHNRSAGSPPHVREVLHFHLGMLVVIGITPACAGSTKKSILNLSEIKDHPRMCGKYEVYGAVDLEIVGITPACAGSTYQSRFVHFHFQDHPRMCGKYT